MRHLLQTCDFQQDRILFEALQTNVSDSRRMLLELTASCAFPKRSARKGSSCPVGCNAASPRASSPPWSLVMMNHACVSKNPSRPNRSVPSRGNRSCPQSGRRSSSIRYTVSACHGRNPMTSTSCVARCRPHRRSSPKRVELRRMGRTHWMTISSRVTLRMIPMSSC